MNITEIHIKLNAENRKIIINTNKESYGFTKLYEDILKNKDCILLRVPGCGFLSNYDEYLMNQLGYYLIKTQPDFKMELNSHWNTISFWFKCSLINDYNDIVKLRVNNKEFISITNLLYIIPLNYSKEKYNNIIYKYRIDDSNIEIKILPHSYLVSIYMR